MKTLRQILLLLVCIAVTACTTESPQEPSMVLEGWIDAGGYPVVLLHKTYVMDRVNYTKKTLAEVIDEQLIMWGKVTVSDGENEQILTGRMDTMYMPPYTYSSINIIGEVGKTYTVTATYKNLSATATTTIPPKATLDSLRVYTDNFGDRHAVAFVNRDNQDEAKYAIFLRYSDDKQFKLCPLGVFDSHTAQDGPMEIMVYNPLANDTTKAYDPLPNFGDDTMHTYQIKVARLDDESFRFWEGYDRMNSTKGIAFVPVFENIEGNVQGGVGNFTGMGSSVYSFSTRKDTTYCY